MNKKFSTLVASLLLTSAFTVYSADAKPMLATPTQVETRAISADVEEVQTVTAVPTNLTTTVTTLADKILPGFTNNARIFYAGTGSTAASSGNQFVRYNNGVVDVTQYYGTNAPAFYWSLVNGKLINNLNQDFQVKGYDHFEIIPVKTATPTDPTYYFAIGTRDTNGNLLFVKAVASYTAGKPAFELTTTSEDVNDAALFCSVETEYNGTATDGAVLNNRLGGGFNLSVSSAIDPAAEVIGADVFAGKLTATDASGNDCASGRFTKASEYMLHNEAGKWIVFEKGGSSPSDGVAEKGSFKLVDDYNASANYVKTFTIYSADNGSGNVKVLVGSVSSNQRLYIAHVGSTFELSYSTTTAAAENYAVASWANQNYVNLKSLLQGKFVKVEFVGSLNGIDNDNKYKENGVLAVRYNTSNKADFVDKDGVYANAPEAQWAVVAGDASGNVVNAFSQANGLTLINREANDVKLITLKALRYTETENVYEVASVGANQAIEDGDLIKITFVENHGKNDGYAVFTENELRNKTWYLGQTRQSADGDINVYWAENHGTHQIGATVEEANASKWNLALVTKNTSKPAYDNQIDSVLVVSKLQTWNAAKSRIDAKADTLVVLPYSFQNRSNSEFVEFNDGTNLNYYECRDYKEGEVKEYKKASDARFALKMKADGTFNYIPLAARTSASYAAQTNVQPETSAISANKVFQENSTEKGTWSKMQMYAKDANSLMFVTEVTAPEYRKLVAEQGVDTVKIYRAENESQVVYEKRDDKSVVDGRTLSFLNIDNVEQFGAINPALYVDTAYVNRGENTRYQYLLGVNVTEHKGFYCPEHGFAAERPCEHAEEVIYKSGRYLINMVDTANVYAIDKNIHNNPYINSTEEGNQCAKLSFVDAIHVLKEVSGQEANADKLYVINNGDTAVIDLSTPDFNVAKFAFKYIDSMNSDEFKIQTKYKKFIGDEVSSVAAIDPYYAVNGGISEEGYLRWVNGCLVVDETYQRGDVFNMDENETRTPTANEEISAENSAVVVVAENGAVVVKGAEGKNVIVSTILGKVVANETLTSDNATIAAPAGIVVVSVEGESFKVVVK